MNARSGVRLEEKDSGSRGPYALLVFALAVAICIPTSGGSAAGMKTKGNVPVAAPLTDAQRNDPV